jgi:hypothetical protein
MPNKPYVRTAEHSRKISEALKGHPIYKSKDRSEKLSRLHKGKKLTVEHRLKMSISQKKRVEEGRNNLYKGGITPLNKAIRESLQFKLWREAVYTRDNYTCVLCGARSSKGNPVILNADHIKKFADYPELRFAIDNGRTLCIDCHKETETYGRRGSI